MEFLNQKPINKGRKFADDNGLRFEIKTEGEVAFIFIDGNKNEKTILTPDGNGKRFRILHPEDARSLKWKFTEDSIRIIEKNDDEKTLA